MRVGRFRSGRRSILIDPFLTRGEANPAAEWKTDEEAVLKVIKRADYIFAGHSHADHIADLPFIAKKFGSKVIGSQTTTNIALTAGVDKSQLVTISGGENLDFKEFSVQVIESEHGIVRRGGRNDGRSSRKSPSHGPGRSWEVVSSKADVISTTLRSANSGSCIKAVAGSSRIISPVCGPISLCSIRWSRSDTTQMLKALATEDRIRPSLRRMAQRYFGRNARIKFAAGSAALHETLNAIDKNIKVVIPKYFETHTLD